MGDRYACRHTAGLHKLVTCFYLSGVVISKKVFLFLVKKRIGFILSNIHCTHCVLRLVVIRWMETCFVQMSDGSMVVACI